MSTLALALSSTLVSPLMTSERAHQITALELQRASHKRRHRDVQGHALVLASCYRKIKRVAAVDCTACIFEVPEFVIGAPPFDLSTAVSYVISSLERNGHTVSYMFPRTLLISWDLEGSGLSTKMQSPPPQATQSYARMREDSKTASQLQQHDASNNKPMPFTDSVAMAAPSVSVDFDLQMPPLLPIMAPRTTGFKPISEFKPKGRFVMRL